VTASSDVRDVREARGSFPATERLAYFNTAATGLASRRLTETYRDLLDRWESSGFDFVQGEQAANDDRAAVARIMGARPEDVALIPSVSAAAGLVAAQFTEARPGQNIVIGEREYSSNHFPWRQLTAKGYDVRQVPFRGGGLEPDDVARHVDSRTQLVAVSAVQTATGHRTDVAAVSALARDVGALVFLDASQLVGALPCADLLTWVDVLVAPDHKFLLHAGRGMGYCYLSPEAQRRFTPVAAGWRAGRLPLESFFGPDMALSETASRFDSSISWVAAVGGQAALAVYDEFGADAIYARNRELTAALVAALADIGWEPVDLPEPNRSTIVSVPLNGREPQPLLGRLRERQVVGSARDGNLRLAVHLYNHEDDIDRLCTALRAERPTS
jgi:cysteine desulfurase / selenocysteine lyase